MAEAFEEQNLPAFDLQHYLGIVRRRHLHFLIPMFIGWMAVWGASWILPPRYKSGTLILVEQPTMPRNFVTPNVNDDLQDRLQSITQQILSRTRLLRIVEQLNLYANEHTPLSPDAIVARMRKDIEIELVRGGQNQITAFNIYYSSGDSHTAQRVTSELTNLFINENLETRQQQSEGNTKFLEDQLETARQGLAEQEEKVREFKAQHVGELPAQLATNLQILSGLQSQLQSEEDSLSAAKQQHVYLQTLIDQYRAFQGSGKTADDAPLGLPAIDQELDRLKAQLADLSSRYTDRHPDVRKLKEHIAKTEKTRERIVADLKTKNNSQQDAAPAVEDPRNPSPLAQVQGQLQANTAEITRREHAIAEMKVKINNYQALLNQEPVREQQLADLTRGYDQSKVNYDDLLKKKNESAMATSMEMMQQGERFRILDPPSLPRNPDFPNRLKFCGIGVGVGLALGVVVAGVFEMLDDRLYDEKELKDLLPVAVISEIPIIVTPTDEKKSKKRAWLGWATASLVLATILAGSVLSYFHG
ncbi:MAG: hypothetical protein LAO09_14520 [Acidobacteriia bacterium]|nr:hypothetical protein [Terriglobia bacterium]